MSRRTTLFPLSALILLIAACASPASTPDNRALPTYIIEPATLTEQAANPDVQLQAETAEPTEVLLDASIKGVLQPWVAEAGNLVAGQSIAWQFSATAGAAIRVGAVAPSANLLLTLQTSDGATLTSGESIETTLPADGVYKVIVQAVEGEGTYEIGLSFPEENDPFRANPTALAQVVGVPTPLPRYAELGTFFGSLEHNITIGEKMAADSPSHIYTFRGQPEQFVEIEMRRVTGMIDPVLTLYDPDGVPMALDDDSDIAQAAILRNVKLPEDGIYMVEANGSGLEGGYSLRLLQYAEFVRPPVTLEAILTPTPVPTYGVPTPAGLTPGNRLEPYAPIQANLPPNSVMIHPLFANAGETIMIGVTPFTGSELQPEFDLVDPDGIVLLTVRSSTSGANGDAVSEPIQVQLDGIYQVFLRGENGTSGDYMISYGKGNTRQEILRGNAIFDQTNTSVIDRKGFLDTWLVRLRKDDVITINVNPGETSQLDPVVRVVPASDPNIVLAADDDSGGGRSAYIREITANEAGYYLIQVSGKDGQSTGAYNLIWRYINVAPTITPPAARSPILTTQGSVADSAYIFYPFYGQAGQRVHIRVIGQGEFDPVAVLTGPDGAELAQSDDVDGDLNPRIFYTLPEDGTYNVRVNGYLAGGSFEIIVEALY